MNERILQPARAATIDAFRQSYEVLANSSCRTGNDNQQEKRLNDIQCLVIHLEKVQARILQSTPIIIPLKKKAIQVNLKAAFKAARVMMLSLF